MLHCSHDLDPADLGLHSGMFQMLPESSGRLVALRVSGKLTKEDMVSVAPPLEEKIRENGKVDLFCDMTDLHGWSLGGFWAD